MMGESRCSSLCEVPKISSMKQSKVCYDND